jgi:hypothetical protein
MRISHPVIAGVIVASALTGASVSGCSSHQKSSTPASGSSGSPTTTTTHVQPGDYISLMIKATDIGAPEPFTATGPPVNNPNGQQGATITFSDQDKSHTIIDTIQVLPDPAAAANQLDSAKALHREALLAKPLSAEVGVDGVTISGTSPDHSKGETVLLFTEGKAFVTLEFDGPTFALAPSEFVLDVGHKQDDAIKKGLGS